MDAIRLKAIKKGSLDLRKLEKMIFFLTFLFVIKSALENAFFTITRILILQYFKRNFLSFLQEFGGLNMAVRGTVGLHLAAKRHAHLSNYKYVPKWRRPINLTEDFNNVLLVAFAPQSIASNDMWMRNLGFDKLSSRGTAIAFYTMAEVSFPNDKIAIKFKHFHDTNCRHQELC